LTNAYIDYADRLYSTPVDKSEYGLPPLTIMVKPLMSLFKAKQGRQFRRNIQNTLKSTTNPIHFSTIVTDALKQSL
jgi:tRNA-dihydrouridine synthase A